MQEKKSLENALEMKEDVVLITKFRHKLGISFRDIEQLSNQLNTIKNQNIIGEAVFAGMQEKLYNIQRTQQQIILHDNPSQDQKEKVRNDF